MSHFDSLEWIVASHHTCLFSSFFDSVKEQTSFIHHTHNGTYLKPVIFPKDQVSGMVRFPKPPFIFDFSDGSFWGVSPGLIASRVCTIIPSVSTLYAADTNHDGVIDWFELQRLKSQRLKS